MENNFQVVLKVSLSVIDGIECRNECFNVKLKKIMFYIATVF